MEKHSNPADEHQSRSWYKTLKMCSIIWSSVPPRLCYWEMGENYKVRMKKVYIRPHLLKKWAKPLNSLSGCLELDSACLHHHPQPIALGNNGLTRTASFSAGWWQEGWVSTSSLQSPDLHGEQLPVSAMKGEVWGEASVPTWMCIVTSQIHLDLNL